MSASQPRRDARPHRRVVHRRRAAPVRRSTARIGGRPAAPASAGRRRSAAPRVRASLEQPGVDRVVHEIGDDLIGSQRGREQWDLVAVVHPDRRGVDHEVGRVRGLVAVVPGHDGSTPDALDCTRRALVAPSADLHRRAGVVKGVRRPARRASGTEDEHAGAIDVEFGRDRTQEALAVGRVAAEAAVAERRHRVHRLQLRGRRAHLVARADRRGLVRHRDREPAEPERAHAPRRRRRRRRRAPRTRRTPNRARAPRYAALCRTGDSEWRTGSPMIPATRVDAEITARRSVAPVRCSPGAARACSRTRGSPACRSRRSRGSRLSRGATRRAATPR